MKKMNTESKIKSRTRSIVGFLKKAPKSGRTYTDMLKHVVKTELHTWYDHSFDRGLISHCMADLRKVTKKIDDRYIISV